jgi:uncharacterized small protein (DUF1192 family)
VLSGTATGIPKTRDGLVEAIRTLRVARRSAIKARTQAINQLKAVLLTGPAELRQALAGRSTRELLGSCRRLRTDKRPAEASDPVTGAAKLTLRRLARRIAALTEEIDELDAELRPLVSKAAPQLMAVYGVGTEVAAQLLTTAGDNPDRPPPRPPSPSSAAPHHYRPAAAAPPATGSTGAATGTPPTRYTSSPWFACPPTNRPRPTPPDDALKA